MTRFAPEMCAMLLPVVNYSPGSVVTERFETLFCQKYPNRPVLMRHHIRTPGRRKDSRMQENRLLLSTKPEKESAP